MSLKMVLRGRGRNRIFLFVKELLIRVCTTNAGNK